MIASITSCTNTSNPSVMLAAALLAKNADEKGLVAKPWVKTSMAPGSQVVTDYYEKAGLWPDLEALGFHLVGYGCTTCIGNSGPLAEPVSAAVNAHDLTVVSVLSGNRNFEGRINPDVKMNYLASPPLVIAYALAGHDGPRLRDRAARARTEAGDVFLKDIWPDPAEVQATSTRRSPADVHRNYADVFAGDERWRGWTTPDGNVFEWDPRVDLRPQAPVLRRHGRHARSRSRTSLARACSRCSATRSPPTTSRPAGSIKAGQPGRCYLAEHGVDRRDFNSYGSRRGNHEVMIRGTFANIRLRNQLVARHRGRLHDATC